MSQFCHLSRWLLVATPVLAISALSLLGGGTPGTITAQESPVLIPADSRVDQPSACTGPGLSGRFWTGTSAEILSQADALAIAAGAPSATFVATHVDYPNGSEDNVNDFGATLSQFLGADGPTLSGFATDNLERSVFIFTGFIRVTNDMDTAPGGLIDIVFAVGSDDGFRLRIGGVTVTEYPDLRGFDFSTGSAAFPSPGEYPVELLFWENGGDTGLEWHSSIEGGPASGAPRETEGIVPLEVLFQDCRRASSVRERPPNIGGGLSGLFQGQPTALPGSQQVAQATPQPSTSGSVIRAPNTGDGGIR